MTTLRALLKKELHFSLDRFMTHIFILALAGLGLIVSSSVWEGVIASPFVGFFAIIFALFVPVAMFESLKREWNESGYLWFNQNRSGMYLLVAKFIAALVHLLCLSVLVILIASLLYIVEQPKIRFVGVDHLFDVVKHYGGYFLFIFFISMIFGALVTASYMIAKSLRWFGSLIGAVFAVAGYIAMFYVTSFEMYQTLFQWGKVKLGAGLTQHMGSERWMELSQVTYYAGDAVFVLLFVGLCFALAAWLLDHQAELK